MEAFLFSFLFIMTIAVDSFVAGAVLASGNISIRGGNRVIVALVSASAFFLTGTAGDKLAARVPGEWVEVSGSSLLIGIGIIIFFGYFQKRPQQADRDESGHIQGKEVWVLSGMLGIDAAMAGWGGVGLPFSPALLSLGLWGTTFLLLTTGQVVGRYMTGGSTVSFRRFSGMMLVVLGFWRLL